MTESPDALTPLLEKAGVSPDELLIDVFLTDTGRIHFRKSCTLVTTNLNHATVTLTHARSAVKAGEACEDMPESAYGTDSINGHEGFYAATLLHYLKDMNHRLDEAEKLVKSKRLPCARDIHDAPFSPWGSGSNLLPPINNKNSMWERKVKEYKTKLNALRDAWAFSLQKDDVKIIKEKITSDPFFKRNLRPESEFLNPQSWFVFDAYCLYGDVDGPVPANSPLLFEYRALCLTYAAAWGRTLQDRIITIPGYAGEALKAFGHSQRLHELDSKPSGAILEVMNSLTENGVHSSVEFKLTTAIALLEK